MVRSSTPSKSKQGRDITWKVTERFAIGTIKEMTTSGKELEMSVLVPMGSNGSFDTETSSIRFDVSEATINTLVSTLDVKDILQDGVLLLDECTNLSTLEA
jgi:hypothetical protein